MVAAPPSPPDVTSSAAPPPAPPALPEVADAAGADSVLFAAIAAYIRAHDRRTLLQCALLGAVAAVATAVGGAAWWPWMTPLLMVGAGATWGLADRGIAARRARPSSSRVDIAALTLVRGTSALVGAGMALFVAAVLLAGLFGQVIS